MLNVKYNLDESFLYIFLWHSFSRMFKIFCSCINIQDFLIDGLKYHVEKDD